MTVPEKHAITAHILDEEYRVLCAPDESDALRMSALFLDKKMREIRNSGKINSVERIAVMAALNISHEYLACNSRKEEYAQEVHQKILHIEDKLEAALFDAGSVGTNETQGEPS